MTDALIVIDMQQGSFGPRTPRHEVLRTTVSSGRTSSADSRRQPGSSG
jgi:hypothetical protein